MLKKMHPPPNTPTHIHTNSLMPRQWQNETDHQTKMKGSAVATGSFVLTLALAIVPLYHHIIDF